MSQREHLLDVATAWLADATGSPSLSSLAKGTGIARGQWYQHFSGKEDLFRALYEERGVRKARTTRELLLDGLGALLKEKELGAIRMEDVAQWADTTPMTLYRLFGDRRGLLRAFSSERTPRQVSHQLDWKKGAPEAQIAGLVERMLIFASGYRGLLLSYFSTDPETQTLFQFMQGLPHSSRKALVQFLEAAMDEGVIRREPVKQLMVLLMGQVMGLSFIQKEWNQEDLPAVAALCTKLFWRGLLRHGEHEDDE